MGKDLNSLRHQLDEIGFSTVLDAARTAVSHPYSAFVENDLPGYITSSAAGALLPIIHQGRAGAVIVPVAGPLMDLLCSCGFAEESAGGNLRFGKWLLTSYKGNYAVRDRAVPGRDPNVYIGEDSLHFVDWLAGTTPCGRALDMGAGSGISSAAISRIAGSVDAVEIDATSCQAIAMTAALNHAEGRIRAVHADLATFSSETPYDLIVGNTPGVPVPTDVIYSPAGNGGHDGLQTSGAALALATELLAKDGRIYLKFESIGDDDGPFSERIIRELVKKKGWSAQFIQHSRIPMEIRSAISTRWSLPLNGDHTTDSLLQTFDRHAGGIGASFFYTCSVVITADGHERFQSLPVYRYRSLTLQTRPAVADYDADLVAHRYVSKLGVLPDGLWELDLAGYMLLPLKRLESLATSARKNLPIKEIVEEVFGQELGRDPMHARSLYSLCTILFDSV